jgi:hypothetical protein
MQSGFYFFGCRQIKTGQKVIVEILNATDKNFGVIGGQRKACKKQNCKSPLK